MNKLAHNYYSLINKIKNKGESKIKLVGIARNEAPYLADWIFHHLYFGFNAIEIYVNNTTDNTHDLLNKLSGIEELTVKDGDPFFAKLQGSPQVSMYIDALDLARKQGYSHVVFIDLDEYWTPLDFESDIHSFVNGYSFDVMTFEWVHKVDDEEPFTKPFTQSWLGFKAPQVKIALNTDFKIKGMNAHNVINTSGKFILANGSPFESDRQSFSTVNKDELAGPIKPAFIMHRSNRSQLEYIAGLLRSTPIQERNKKSVKFKYNRGGYKDRQDAQDIRFPEDKFKQYDDARNNFYKQYLIEDELNTAREFVESQYKKAINLIENAEPSDHQVLEKVLKKVTLEDVTNAYSKYQQKN